MSTNFDILEKEHLSEHPLPTKATFEEFSSSKLADYFFVNDQKWIQNNLLWNEINVLLEIFLIMKTRKIPSSINGYFEVLKFSSRRRAQKKMTTWFA